jgi:hypothetical protein
MFFTKLSKFFSVTLVALLLIASTYFVNVQAITSGEACNQRSYKGVWRQNGKGWNGQNVIVASSSVVGKAQASGYNEAEIQSQINDGFKVLWEKIVQSGISKYPSAVGQLLSSSQSELWWANETSGTRGIKYNPNSGTNFTGPIRRYVGTGAVEYARSYPSNVRAQTTALNWDKAIDVARANNNEARARELEYIKVNIEELSKSFLDGKGYSSTSVEIKGFSQVAKSVFFHESGWEPAVLHGDNKQDGYRCAIGVGLSAVMGHFPGTQVADFRGNLPGVNSSPDQLTDSPIVPQSVADDSFNLMFTELGKSEIKSIDDALNDFLTKPLPDATPLVEQALDNSFTLTGGFLSSCNGANPNSSIPENLRKNTAQVLVSCIRDIIGLIFGIGVVALVVQIASLQLGVLSDAGNGSPVIMTRKKLRGGLIGLFLLGGGFLILQLFYQPLGSFRF